MWDHVFCVCVCTSICACERTMLLLLWSCFSGLFSFRHNRRSMLLPHCVAWPISSTYGLHGMCILLHWIVALGHPIFSDFSYRKHILSISALFWSATSERGNQHFPLDWNGHWSSSLWSRCALCHSMDGWVTKQRKTHPHKHNTFYSHVSYVTPRIRSSPHIPSSTIPSPSLPIDIIMIAVRNIKFNFFPNLFY